MPYRRRRLRILAVVALINWQGVQHLDLDVVPKIIEGNNRLYSSENVSFEVMKSDFGLIPRANLLIVKGGLQRLPNSEIKRIQRDLLPSVREMPAY